ncbi:MAG: hypothetical protein HY236_00965 [Acidobacteria bacterium]|nr:hypothetical protein [Acidobacteriota bacterium]
MREIAVILLLAAGNLEAAGVMTVLIPGGGIAPHAAVDSKGVVHVVYGREGNGYYVKSADNGRTFSAPLRVNTRDRVVSVGRERGPRIALGGSESVHVAWIGPAGKGAYYTLLESGKFLPERNLNEAGSAVDGTAIAADSRGRVFVLWLDSRLPEDPRSPVANAIFFARSEDNGVTFAPSEEMKSGYPGRACACCNLAATIDKQGTLWVAFRGGYEALRDMQLAASRDGRRFTWHEVHKDGWKLVACPMSGADLLVDTTAALPAVAWMSQGEVYFRLGDGPRQAAPLPRAGNRNFPLLLANASGDRLLAWTEGMEVHWHLTAASGKALDGVEKHLTHNSRPGGFTGRDGNFYLIP